MILYLLCCWSGVILFAILVGSKYRWSRPPYGSFACFALFGLLSAAPALLFNNFISRETELWVFSSNKLHSFLGFAISAGFGEEFWKMGAGVLVYIGLVAVGKTLREADCVLGFAALGMAFGCIENIISYSNLDWKVMLIRGIVAVPLHGTMGFIHGLAVNRARRLGSVLPLLQGYVTAAVLHTLWDTWNIVLPDEHMSLFLVPFTCLMYAWASAVWRRVPELSQEELIVDRL